MRRQSNSSRSLYLAWALAGLTAVACTDVEIYPPTGLTIPAERIDDASLTYDADSSDVVLTWTAPATNGGTREIARYDIRFEYGDTLAWDSAEAALDAPQPAGAGARQVYRFRDPSPGQRLLAAIRSIDASGNVSEISNVASARIPGFEVGGTATGVISGRPIKGLLVTLSDPSDKRSTYTGADGRFSFRDLPRSRYVLRLETTGDPPTRFPVEFPLLLTDDVDFHLHMIPFAASTVYPALSRLGVLQEAVGARGYNTVLRKWPSLPVDVYVPELVNAHGVDYHSVALAAMDRWMALTGVPLFRPVPEPPASGVTMDFRTPADMGIQVGITRHEDLPDGTPLHSDIDIVDNFSNIVVLKRVMMHELGHTIRLYHLPRGFLMFGGQPLPEDPTGDEVWVVRVRHGLPDRIDLAIYREVEE